MNKIDFFAAISGQSQDVEIDGIVVKIRSLNVLETKQLQNIKDPFDMSMQMIVMGLVEPKLDPSDVVQLGNSQAGFIGKLAKEISKISGMVEDDVPTDGNG